MAAPIRHTNHTGHIGRLTTTHQPADNLWVDELDQWAVSRASWAFPQTQLDFSKFPTREWWRWTSQLLILSSGANCARYLVRLHLVQETILWGEEIYIWVFILKFHSIHEVFRTLLASSHKGQFSLQLFFCKSVHGHCWKADWCDAKDRLAWIGVDGGELLVPAIHHHMFFSGTIFTGQEITINWLQCNADMSRISRIDILWL